MGDALGLAVLVVLYLFMGVWPAYRAMVGKYAECRRQGIKLSDAHGFTRSAAVYTLVAWPVVLFKGLKEAVWKAVARRAERDSWTDQELQARRIAELERELKRYEEDR